MVRCSWQKHLAQSQAQYRSSFNVRGYFFRQGRFASTLAQPSGVRLRFDCLLSTSVATFVTQISHLPFCVLPHLSSPSHPKPSLTRLLPSFRAALLALRWSHVPLLGPTLAWPVFPAFCSFFWSFFLLPFCSCNGWGQIRGALFSDTGPRIKIILLPTLGYWDCAFLLGEATELSQTRHRLCERRPRATVA